MSNSINQQMTALANAVRNKANIQSKLTIANMITILSELNLTGSNITLGEIDQNGNFQPLSFSETESSPSGQSIPISSYYTWNNISSTPNIIPTPTPTPTIEYLTEQYSGRINIQFTYSNESTHNSILTKAGNRYWTGTNNSGFYEEDMNPIYLELPMEISIDNTPPGVIGFVEQPYGDPIDGLYINKGNSIETSLPLNQNIIGLSNISLQAFNDEPITSIIITKLD